MSSGMHSLCMLLLAFAIDALAAPLELPKNIPALAEVQFLIEEWPGKRTAYSVQIADHEHNIAEYLGKLDAIASEMLRGSATNSAAFYRQIANDMRLRLIAREPLSE